MPAGLALNHLSFQGAMLAGPALAGSILAAGGLSACYLLDVAALGVALHAAVRLPAIQRAAAAPSSAGRGATGWRATWEAWRLIARRPPLAGSVATDLAATVLAMPVALFPALNAARFDGDPQTLGLFLPAIAAGGAWGAALAGVGLVDSLAPTLVLLALAGAADTVSVIARAGAVSALTSPALAAVTGGLACVAVVAVLAVRNPTLRRWRASGGS